MKKVTKRIILSIVSLAFIAVALGTTTFAWFTLSNVATVSDIEGTVQAGEGIEITLSDNEYKTIDRWDLLQLVNELKLAGAEAIKILSLYKLILELSQTIL